MRAKSMTSGSRTRCRDYVARPLVAKTARGELSTAKGRRTWTDAQTLHLVPYSGGRIIDEIKRRDVDDWKTSLALQVRAGKLSAHTVNGRLRVLLSTLRSAVIEYELAYDPTRAVKPLDTSTWQTYTEEQRTRSRSRKCPHSSPRRARCFRSTTRSSRSAS